MINNKKNNKTKFKEMIGGKFRTGIKINLEEWLEISNKQFIQKAK